MLSDEEYEKASREYESKLSEPPKSEEELLEEIKEKEFWEEYYADLEFSRRRENGIN